MPEFKEDWTTSMGRTKVWEALFSELKGKENLCILEIGSYEGRSCIWWLENIATHPTATVTCVDPWLPYGDLPGRPMDDVYSRFLANVSSYGTKVETRREFSTVALASMICWRKRFDLIYVDGDHRPAAAVTDAMLSLELLKPQGFLALDDYGMDPKAGLNPLLPKAMDDFAMYVNDRASVIHREYQLILRKR